MDFAVDLILEGQWLVNVLIEYTIYNMIINIIIWLKWLVYDIYIYIHTIWIHMDGIVFVDRFRICEELSSCRGGYK